MISPHKFREVVFQLLYSADFSQCPMEDIMPMVMEKVTVTKKVVREAYAMQQLITAREEEIDAMIKKHAQNYQVNRIPKVEHNVLRLGIYELLYCPDQPFKITISEAIRLSRKFATKESANFINAVLDSVYQSIEPC
ncbi:MULTISPECIES: transcription antitermination factor NusB [Candidatus Rhabdochlamydia]|nr:MULTISPECIES: transcription antitermination factor NusB [Rhabdochlamydia]KAG6559834.1 N utilization substance protein B [Candidatus Rhabdochlamydia sp. W815]